MWNASLHDIHDDVCVISTSDKDAPVALNRLLGIATKKGIADSTFIFKYASLLTIVEACPMNRTIRWDAGNGSEIVWELRFSGVTRQSALDQIDAVQADLKARVNDALALKDHVKEASELVDLGCIVDAVDEGRAIAQSLLNCLNCHYETLTSLKEIV